MAVAPMCPALWEATLRAVKAARARGREYIASGKYTSKLDVPKFEKNSQGWSITTSRNGFLADSDAPVDWHNMFGRTVGPFSTIDWHEVPEFAAAIAEVREMALADSTLEKSISLLSSAKQSPGERAQQIDFEYTRFIGDIVGRAEATDAQSDGELFAIYHELETARFASELVGDIVVPIALTPFDLGEPVEIAAGIWIEPLDEGTQRARAVSAMWGGPVSAHVVAAATHAIVVCQVTFSNLGGPFRRFDRIEDHLSSVDRFLECLHIETGRDTGYAQVFVRPKGWADGWIYDLPPVEKVELVHRYPDTFDRGGWTNPQVAIDASSFEVTTRLYSALGTSPANVHLAARRSMRAVMRSDVDDETLDASIGLEALLLDNNDRDEITHRMAQRAAAALAPEYLPEAIYRLVKKIYEHRSAIVHGRTKKDETVRVGEFTSTASGAARLLLQMLLKNLLESDEPWTPSNLDDRILRGLQSGTPEKSET